MSSDVLVLNVRARGVGRLARWLGEAADAGEPFRVTLRQLGSSDVVVDAPVVWVCENPAVVIDVATRLGASAGTLVCTEGVPTDAFWDLTTRRSSASELRVRADFDATGLAIVGSIVARAGGRPWRFDAATYRAALDAHGRDAPLPRSKGTPPPTPWDPPLQAAVAADGRAVYEELLLDATLADLASAG